MRSAGAMVLFAAAVASCSRDRPPEPTARSEALVLPSADDPLADGPGRDVYAGACLACHSYRYITMQPPLSRKAWTAEVDKMIKAYGAPVTPEQAPRIVDYLVAGNGTP